MRGTWAIALLTGILWLGLALPVSAQTPAPSVVRPDFAVAVGWLNGNKGEFDSNNDWYNRSLQIAGSVGWYWTEHLKTELEGSVSNRARLYISREEQFNGIRSHVSGDLSVSTRRLSLSQLYQFGENAWFHPHLAAGVDFNWEHTSLFDYDVYQYLANRPPSIVRPATRHPDRTDLHVRPFIGAGFKGYLSPRAFFRSDLRIVAAERVEDVIVRFGFGMDF
jgi:hypothetical protein